MGAPVRNAGGSDAVRGGVSGPVAPGIGTAEQRSPLCVVAPSSSESPRLGPTPRTGTPQTPHHHENGNASFRVTPYHRFWGQHLEQVPTNPTIMRMELQDLGFISTLLIVVSLLCVQEFFQIVYLLMGVYDRRMVNFVTAGFFVRVSANMGND